MKHEIFCGAKETMEIIANRGATALNPRTHKWQIIDTSAEYEVRKTETKEPSSLYSLFSNLPLREIAEQKKLIL
jgi:hypothetical protein